MSGLDLPREWPHDEDGCQGTRCDYCGCCMHTKPDAWCPIADMPYGMRCPNPDCSCEGTS